MTLRKYPSRPLQKRRSWQRSYLGGRGGDAGTSLTFDADGTLIVGGYTTSSDFATADTAFPLNGGEDGFGAWLNADTGKVLSSIYVGSAGQNRIAAVAADSQGGLYLAGTY